MTEGIETMVRWDEKPVPLDSSNPFLMQTAIRELNAFREKHRDRMALIEYNQRSLTGDIEQLQDDVVILQNNLSEVGYPDFINTYPEGLVVEYGDVAFVAFSLTGNVGNGRNVIATNMPQISSVSTVKPGLMCQAYTTDGHSPLYVKCYVDEIGELIVTAPASEDVITCDIMISGFYITNKRD